MQKVLKVHVGLTRTPHCIFPFSFFSSSNLQPSGAGVELGGGRTGIVRRGSVSNESGRSLGLVRLTVVPVAAVGGGRAVEARRAAAEAALLCSSVDHGVAPGGADRRLDQ